MTANSADAPIRPTTIEEDVEAAKESQGIVARGQRGAFLTRQQALEELSAEEKSYQDSLYRSGQTADAACIAGLKLVKALKEQVRQAKLQPGKWIDLAAARGELAAAQAKVQRDKKSQETKGEAFNEGLKELHKKYVQI